MRILRPRLLVADDDPFFRETLQLVLEAGGYQAVLASSGEEAISLASQVEVHLLLLDFHMPRLTGLQTFRRIREIKGLLPCILMSGAIDQATIEEARRESVVEILRKPFTTDQLSSALKQALGQGFE